MDKYNFTVNEVVTLASIIERESKLDEERELISAVFHNRLKKGNAIAILCNSSICTRRKKRDIV